MDNVAKAVCDQGARQMQQGAAEFLELINNRKKDRNTCLIVLLHGDGETVQELGPAEQWCFDPAQEWNDCFTARYRADGKGAVVAPLIRKLCEDAMQSAGARSRKGPARKGSAKAYEWGRLRRALAALSARAADMPDQALIEEFGSVLRDELAKGERLVLFCEVDEPPERRPTESRLIELGLGQDHISQLQKWMPERFVLVLAGIGDRPGPRVPDERIVRLQLGGDYFETVPPENRSQPLAGDHPEGDDTLDIESEVNALADAIAARDMQTPFAVGVLGGWGAGKSFVLHLLEQRLLSIRKEDVHNPLARAISPYVGHFYIVRFDAWTYAKADLWSSLMHRMLLALNDQIAYEQLKVRRYCDVAHEDKKKGEVETVRAIDQRLPAGTAGEAPVTVNERLAEAIRELSSAETTDTEIADRISQYHREKRKLFDAKFKTLLEGADGFTPNVVERMQASGADTQNVVENLENDLLWSRLRGLNSHLREKLDTQRIELKAAQSALAELRARLEETADTELRVARWKSWSSRFAGVLGADFRKAVETKINEATASNENAPASGNSTTITDLPFEEAMESVGIIRMVSGGLDRRSLALFTAYAVSGLLVVAIAYQFAERWVIESGVIGGILAGSGALSAVKRAWRRANDWLRAQVEAFNAFDQSVRAEQEARRVALVEEKMSADTEVREGAERVADLKADVDSLTRKVGLTAGHKTLLDFIADRLRAEGGYVERLGLLHQVQTDIQELSDGLFSDALCVLGKEAGTPDEAKLNREQGRDLKLAGVDLDKVLFPRGTPRVVLFIDDLDRCPPTRVVEVLEAAQLLVKTKLFVVVIAMDVRYVTKALEKAYEGVLDRRGAPSGLDYIEKIIQVPYRIRPISAEAMPGYLRSQTLQISEPETSEAPRGNGSGFVEEGSVSGIFPPSESQSRIDETIPQQVLAFDDAELALIETGAFAAGISPRATKRLLNVMKLIKIIWYRQSQDEVPMETKQAVVFFLTLSACYAEIMRRVLLELERVVAVGSGRDFRAPLARLLKRIADDWEGVEGRKIEWKQFRTAVGDTTLLPGTINIERLGRRNIELIRSFSFVGEVDLPQDPGVQQVALQLHDPVRIAQDDSPDP